MVVIVGAIAELERSLIVERVKAGMRRARLDGRQIGRCTTRYTNGRVFAWPSVSSRLALHGSYHRTVRPVSESSRPDPRKGEKLSIDMLE